MFKHLKILLKTLFSLCATLIGSITTFMKASECHDKNWPFQSLFALSSIYFDETLWLTQRNFLLRVSKMIFWSLKVKHNLSLFLASMSLPSNKYLGQFLWYIGDDTTSFYTKVLLALPLATFFFCCFFFIRRQRERQRWWWERERGSLKVCLVYQICPFIP